jgi:hypothetical protein
LVYKLPSKHDTLSTNPSTTKKKKKKKKTQKDLRWYLIEAFS